MFRRCQLCRCHCIESSYSLDEICYFSFVFDCAHVSWPYTLFHCHLFVDFSVVSSFHSFERRRQQQHLEEDAQLKQRSHSLCDYDVNVNVNCNEMTASSSSSSLITDFGIIVVAVEPIDTRSTTVIVVLIEFSHFQLHSCCSDGPHSQSIAFYL